MIDDRMAPHWRADHWLIALLLTALRVLYAGAQLTGGDRFLAVPIALESGWPGTYPPGDILVMAGLHSGFHLYVGLGKLAAALSLAPAVLWDVGLLLTLYATSLLLLRLGEFLTGRRDLAVFAVAVLMLMPGFRGTLAWTPFPSAEFTTGTLAGAAGLYVVWSAWREHWMRAGATTGVLFNLHPSMGFISGVLMLAVAVVTSQGRKRQGAALTLAALLAMPNVIAMGMHLFGGNAAPATFDEIAAYQRQHTLRNFWDAELPFYTAWLALTIAGARALDASTRRRVLAVVAAIQILMVSYIVGVELLRSTSVLVFFLFRASAYIKVFGAMVLVLLAANALAADPRNWRSFALAGLLFLAAFLQNEMGGAACLMLALGLVLSLQPTRIARGVSAMVVVLAVVMVVSIGWRRFGIAVASRDLQAVIVAVGTLLPLLAIPVVRGAEIRSFASGPEMRPSPLWAGVAAIALASLLLRHPYDWSWRYLLSDPVAHLQERARFDEPAESLGAMEQWARVALPRSALVAVPPDTREATAFRLRTRRGLFSSPGDMAQLTYSPAVFRESAQRMQLLRRYFTGAGAPMTGCMRLDAQGAADFRQLGATHIACRRDDQPGVPLAAVYRDTTWVLYAF